MSDYIVIAHMQNDHGLRHHVLKGFPVEWMRGTRQQCEAKAEIWRRYYRSVQVLKVEEVPK